MTEFNTTDNKITDAEGAFFNVRMIGENRYGNGDRSFGAHNPFLSEALLTASADAVEATYGLAVSAQVQAVMEQVKARNPRARPKFTISQR